MVSRGEREGVGDAPVNADSRKPVLWSASAHVSGENNEPLPGLSDNGRGLYRATDVAGGAKAKRPQLGYFDLRPALVQGSHSDLAGAEPTGVIDAHPARRGVAGPSVKETLKSPVQIVQGGLKSALRNVSYPVECRPESGEFSTLAGKADVAALKGVELPPKVSALLQGEIVDQPRHTDPMAENFGLLGSRIEPEAEASVHGAIITEHRSLTNV